MMIDVTILLFYHTIYNKNKLHNNGIIRYLIFSRLPQRGM